MKLFHLRSLAGAALAATFFAAPLCRAQTMKTNADVPADFPTFSVPGKDKEMTELRELYWLHYLGAGPKATIWDEWLPRPALWPRTDQTQQMREAWSAALTHREMDDEGYVSSGQQASIAHPMGWPFPYWNQGFGTFGWHFSFKDTVNSDWRQKDVNDPAGWALQNAHATGVGEYGWDLQLDAPGATAATPKGDFDSYQAPFVQLRWIAKGIGDAQPFIEWTTKDKPNFDAARRVYFENAEKRTETRANESPVVRYTLIPMYKNVAWKGRVTQLRVNFDNAEKGAVTIQALFSTYDTRHNINGQNFVMACSEVFHWTRDLGFLRANINRMRMALRYVIKEHHTMENKAVLTDWVGHDGRGAIWFGPNRGAPILDEMARTQGQPHPSKEFPLKKSLIGHGIGSNYWDLLPFGHLDCYATMRLYGALRRMAELERDIAAHPEWNVPMGVLALSPQEMEKHAADLKANGNTLFWNAATQRFAAGIDADGKMHDYGMTFLNLEAIYYDFATPQHAQQIMTWIEGQRLVASDTSRGADIYRWRFAPRATTKRNLQYYTFPWYAPESIPFGAQVEDGGAVLGFTYHDLMARLKVRGADDAAARLKEIATWFGEVQEAGGYRAYYKDGKRGTTLQGGGTAGGLGVDNEFYESVLATQVMLDGFMGFTAESDGFSLNPQLPRSWPQLSIDRIAWQDLTLSIRATPQEIEIKRALASTREVEPALLHLPRGNWTARAQDENGAALPTGVSKRTGGAFRVDWNRVATLRLTRAVATR